MLVGSPNDEEWGIELGDRVLILRPRPLLCFLSLFKVRDAVLRGAGAALLPRSMVEDDLASGRLVRWGDLRDHA